MRPRLHPMPYEVFFERDGEILKLAAHSHSQAMVAYRHLKAEGRDPSIFIGDLELDVDRGEVRA